VKITGDSRRGIKATEMVWTTHPPATSRVSPENIMTKGSVGDHISIFYPDLDFFNTNMYM
jgi:hypothetical protein